MRTAKGARWVTLYRVDDSLLRVIYEPLRDYQIHNLKVKGWKEVL